MFLFPLFKVLGWDAPLDMHDAPVWELPAVSATLPDDRLSSTSVKLWGS